MADRTRKTSIFFKQELTYGAEDTSSTSDGSGFTAVKCLTVDLLTNPQAQLEANFATGRNRVSPAIMGPDSAQVTFTTPIQGLVSFAGDGTNASTISNDYLDFIMINLLGSASTTAGDGLDAASTASSLVTDESAPFTNQDMVAVQGASFDSGRVNWRRVAGTASPYTLDRDFNATPDGSEVAYGAKMYRPGTPGASLSVCYNLDGVVYLLLGGRVTSMSMAMNAGELATVSVTMDFDSLTDDTSTKTALPSIDTFAGTPIKGVLGSFAWGSTEYAAKSVSIDFGVGAQPDQTVTTTNGRSDINIISCNPTVAVEPAFATNWSTDFKAGTARILSVQFGSGVVSGGVLNGCSFYAESARLTSAEASDDGGRLRDSLAFSVVDEGIFTGAIVSEYFQFSRA